MLEKINEVTIGFLDRVFIGKYKKYSLFFTAFLDSIIAILPTDLITVYYFLRNPKGNIYLQSFFIGLGSVLGGTLLYFFAANLVEFFPTILSSEYFIKLSEIILYSFWLQFIFISFFAFSSVIPFTWLSVLMGILNIQYILIYIPTIFLGRFLRFLFISFLTKRYGKDSLVFLKKNIRIGFVFVFLIFIIYVISKFI